MFRYRFLKFHPSFVKWRLEFGTQALSFDYQTASYDAIFPDRIVTEKNFGGELGFVAGFALNRKELEIAKDAILEHLAKNVSKISHDAEIALTQNGLKNYHIAVDDELHKNASRRRAEPYLQASAREF